MMQGNWPTISQQTVKELFKKLSRNKLSKNCSKDGQFQLLGFVYGLLQMTKPFEASTES